MLLNTLYSQIINQILLLEFFNIFDAVFYKSSQVTPMIGKHRNHWMKIECMTFPVSLRRLHMIITSPSIYYSVCSVIVCTSRESSLDIKPTEYSCQYKVRFICVNLQFDFSRCAVLRTRPLTKYASGSDALYRRLGSDF